MTAAAQAESVGSGADVTDLPDARQLQALLVDIFAQTGQKVEISDPLVAAALIHSGLLRRAGQDAARAITQAAQSAPGSQLDDDVKRAISELGLWHTRAMLGAVLFVICFLASALGGLLTSSSCH